jgi:hypothetical protein
MIQYSTFLHTYTSLNPVPNAQVCVYLNICWVCCWYWYQNLGGAPPDDAIHQWMDDGTDGWTGHVMPSMDGWRDGWMDGSHDAIYGWMTGRMDGWVTWCHPWMDDRMDGWTGHMMPSMDGWMDGQTGHVKKLHEKRPWPLLLSFTIHKYR